MRMVSVIGHDIRDRPRPGTATGSLNLLECFTASTISGDYDLDVPVAHSLHNSNQVATPAAPSPRQNAKRASEPVH